MKIKKEWLNFQSLKVRFYSSEWDSSKRSTLNVLESILCLDINGKIFVKMTIFVILKAKSLDYIYFLYPNNTTLSIFCILLLLLVLLIYYYTTFWIKYQILFSQDMILFLEAYSQDISNLLYDVWLWIVSVITLHVTWNCGIISQTNGILRMGKVSVVC